MFDIIYIGNQKGAYNLVDPQRYSGAIISRVYLLKQGRNPGGQYRLKYTGTKLNLGNQISRLLSMVCEVLVTHTPISL